MKSLEMEKGLLDLVPIALTCLREAAQRGDASAATTILRYSVVPADRREGEAAELERLRMTDDDTEEGDDGG